MDAKVLLNLFERPQEPVFVPKGNNEVFQVPEEYLTDRFKPLTGITDRFGADNKKIKVKKITLPDLSLPMKLGRKDHFSLFMPSHQRMASRLIEVYMGMRNLEDFISASVYSRDRLNPNLFNYCLSVAILHRPDTKSLDIPPLSEIFPDKFINKELLERAKEETNLIPTGLREPLEIPRDFTGSDLDFEHRLSYFREDLGINLHHWHFHLVYPHDGPKEIIDKDRRGELFYYMHQQVLARYNMERFSNNLGRVKRFINWREPIEEGYFPKLDSLSSSRNWASRFANAKLSDVSRDIDSAKFDIQDLERWRDRVFAAIHSGVVVDEEGKFVELTESGGIDILGNMMESCALSVNRNVYGDIHNLGHLAISVIHDPQGHFLENVSVMGDTATAMRDPIFYRWHGFIDDVFQEHKSTLPRYTRDQLDYTGVKITSLELESDAPSAPKNRLFTFWQQSDVDMSRGLDFTQRGPVFARFTHLQHKPFQYILNVDNRGGAKKGTCRLFIAPKLDERGVPFQLKDQRSLFVELDKFVVDLTEGKQQIKRLSTQSSVTIPFERTFRNLDKERPAAGNNLESFNHCGCGWPQHMLIAKGSAAGLSCQLFAMISNYKDDKVEQSSSSSGRTECLEAYSYCGRRGQKYPDKRAMGFPFDRPPINDVDTIDRFLTPNMRVTEVTIQHMDITVKPTQ